MRLRILALAMLFPLSSAAMADDIAVCNSVTKLSRIGDVATLRARFMPVVAACTRRLRKSSNPAIPINSRGVAWYIMKEDDKALADFTSVITLYPGKDAFHAYSNRANILTDRGDYDGALADISEVIRRVPGKAMTYYNRALLWLLKKDKDRAFTDINKALELDPKYTKALNSRGLRYLERGEYDRALRDFNEVIRLKPRGDHGYAIRGLYWRQRGDLDRAMDDLNKAVELADRSEVLDHYLRAETLRYRGEFDRALRDLNEAARRAPDHVPTVLARGLVLEKKGDLAAARAEFERVVKSPRASRSAEEIDAAQARETAEVRLAAYDSGDVQPAIAVSPPRVTSETSIPTNVISAPIVSKPITSARMQATARQGRRVALVVGNSAYQKVPALTNPQKDAEAVAASLRNIGFEKVTVASDGSKDAMISALRAFADEADKADWAMVYYTGHGIEVNGRNYLIPVDATLKTDRDVQFEAIPMDQVMAAIDGAKKLKLIVLDACRDNPFAPKMERTGVRDAVAAASTAGGTLGTRSIGRGLGEVKVTGASLVVFAAKHGQTALDGEGANSPFAVALVQRIATPGVEINKIFRLVRDDVMEATAGRQEPYTYGSLPGKEDFFFVAAK